MDPTHASWSAIAVRSGPCCLCCCCCCRCLAAAQGLLDPKHLEDLTGLTELHRASEAALEAWASSDDEEGELGGVYAGAGAGSSLGEQRGAPTGAQPGAAAAEGEEDWEEL